MTWTEADIARIAAQDGYSVVDGRLPVKNDTAVTGANKGIVGQPATVRKKSETELRFEREYLEPRLDTVSIFWQYEPSIRMVGQTYSPDYLEVCRDGQVNFYEVKGSFSLGSESRSSAKLRWATSEYGTDTIRFYWAKWDGSKWKLRQIKTERARVK